MFVPPPQITTRVFARVPGALRIRGRTNPWIETHRGGCATDCFLEGPSFDRSGNLYVTDVAWGRIFRVSPDGLFEVVVEYDGLPNGLKIHRDGRIVVADFKNGLMQLDPESGHIRSVVSDYQGEPLHGCNDLVFSSDGDLYFTDQGESGLHAPYGRVFRYTRERILELVLENVPSPNGLVLGIDENTLFLNVTRDNAVWRVPLTQNGRPSKVGAFVRLSGGIGPDGLAMDVRGNLAIAHIGLGAIWLISAKGEPLLRVNSCEGDMTTNLAYGVADPTNLYITESESGSILIAEMPVEGRSMYSQMANAPG